MHAIAIEGPSCAGKTTLASDLAGRWGSKLVPCYYHSVADPSALPHPEPLTAGQALTNLAALLAVERQRIRLFREAANQAAGPVIIDRTVATLLAHTFAVGRVHNFDCTAEAEDMVACNAQLAPDRVFILRVPHTVIIERAEKRVGMPKILTNPVFLRAFDDYLSQRPSTLVVTESDHAARVSLIEDNVGGIR